MINVTGRLVVSNLSILTTVKNAENSNAIAINANGF